MDKLREQMAHIICGEAKCPGNCPFYEGKEFPCQSKKPDKILALIAEQGEPPVLSDKEIDEATYYGIGSRRLYAERNVAKTQRDACIPWGLAQKQEGRREVVEWVDNAMGEHPGNNFHVLYKRTWQAYKQKLELPSPLFVA